MQTQTSTTDDSTGDTHMFAGFMKLEPEKAARILPAFKANVAHLVELRLKQAKLMNQMVYLVALKSKGLEGKQVGGIIRECTRLQRKTGPDGGTETVRVDNIDWRTGQPKSVFHQPNPNGRIVGVLLREPGAAPVKFDEPLESWT